MSTSTTRKIHYVLRGAQGRAARWGYVGVNVAELAKAPSPRKPKPDPPSAQEAADALRDDIVSGRLKPGDQLPTVVQFAAEYTVAPARRTARWPHSPRKA